jgi:hypothetical protein
MSHEDHKRVLLDLARQLDAGEELDTSQMQYLAIVFYRIASGEDANKVLGVQPLRGQKSSDLVNRRRMSMILHWVACAINPDPDNDKKAMTLSEACIQAMDTIVPEAKAAFPEADYRSYDAEYIQRCWSDPAYAHMRSTKRGYFDMDLPYQTL